MPTQSSRVAARLTLILVVVLLVCIASFFIPVKPARAAPTDDYPSQWAAPVPMDSKIDSWGYPNRECTSFVAWRLSSRNGFNARGYGNAIDWKQNALKAGYTVDQKPVAGSVAWFSIGHVAWVTSVNGNTVTIEEYNYDYKGDYHWRTISPTSAYFIHFKALTPPPTILGTDHLNPGDQMPLNSEIDSTDGRLRFVFQADSNLVIYGPGEALWASNTGGKNAAALIMQTDGNLVLYRSGGYALWASGTHGTNTFWMQTDGNAVIYNQNGSAIWNSNSWYGSIGATYYSSDTLGTNHGFGLNTYLRSSHWHYWLLLQSDGNLVLYSPGYTVLWKSNTGSPTNYLLMQTDGNLVLYAPGGSPTWATHTSGSGAALVMQDDGNAVVYAGGKALWSSNTAP